MSIFEDSLICLFRKMLEKTGLGRACFRPTRNSGVGSGRTSCLARNSGVGSGCAFQLARNSGVGNRIHVRES